MLSTILRGVVIGMGATAVLDLWNVLLRRAFGIPSLDYCLLGRWVRHMPRKFRHASIARAAPKANECPVGWLVHYSIGATLAIPLALAGAESWLPNPSLPVAMLYGVATVVLPFFILQPSLGLGIASGKTARPMAARLKSVVSHAVFGLGLYLCALALAVTAI